MRHNTFFYVVRIFFLPVLFLLSANSAEAASLKVSPDTGVYTAGGTFMTSILVNTQGKPINAADGQLTFNPKELSVVSASRGSSIFSLWTQEPSFSNATGIISFGGGSPSGYTGGAGTIFTVTFKALAAGTPKVTFKGGSILAADGLGTNVLTTMTGGTYTISALTATPEPEYIAPPNTPKAPVVTSDTHPDQTLWYKATTAKLSWKVPEGIVAVRTLLDTAPSTIPTIVYDDPITNRELTDLPQGESYFHIQFKNSDGWGKITHFRIGVDSDAPSIFTIAEKQTDEAAPVRTLVFTIEDVSPIQKYSIQIDGGEVTEFKDEKTTHEYALPILLPGHHTVIVEAFDGAGNSRVATYSFDVVSFEAPVFTEYPTRLNTEVIPAISGTTRPRSRVDVTVTGIEGGEKIYQVTSTDDGNFTFIPDSAFPLGVYDIIAVATDEYGATSEPSTAIRIIVETPGYVRIGSMMISALSVIVPLIALILVLIFGLWYLWHRLLGWRKRVLGEAYEAEDKLRIELDEVITNLNIKVGELKESRKGKLTKAETSLIEQMEEDIADAREKIKKEITDIENIVE